MTTSYHPEYDDSTTNLYDKPDDDETAIEINAELEQSTLDNGNFTATTSYGISTDHTSKFSTSESQSVSVSPYQHSLNDVVMGQMKQSSSASVSSATVPSSMPASPSRFMMSTSNLKTNHMSSVEKIISITPTCYLKPKSFFVAWNSVITLVFTGWPEPIDTMKTELENAHLLCSEFFGSKFPKITLASVKDGVEMTPKILFKIRRLCQQTIIPKDYVLCLDALSVVLFENRSQESVIYEKIIPLKKKHVQY